MAAEQSQRDGNIITSLLGVTDDSNEETRNLLVDPTTGRLKVNATISTDLTDLDNVNTTNETAGDILYYNGSNWVNLGVGSTGQVLTVNSGATAPEWASLGSGDVSGPGSATDNAIARFDGTGGKTIQNSGVTIDDSDNINTTGNQFTINSSGNAFSILDRGDTSSFALFQAKTAGTTKASIGLYNDTTDNLRINLDGASAGKNDVLRFIVDTEAVFNEGGGDLDLRVETSGQENTLFVDGGNDNIGVATNSPDTSSLLDLTSTTAGFLPPRMTTTQRDNITTPAEGLVIHNTSTNELNFYNGTSWQTAVGLLNVAQDTTPQLGGNLDAQSNQITDVGNLTVNQDSDASGVTLSGFDDESTNNLSLNVNALGRGEIDTTDQFDYKINTISVSQLDSAGWLARDDIKLAVGDSKDHWFLYDSTNTQFEFENNTGLIFTVADGTTNINLQNNQITNAVLTNPVIAQIDDSNGNEALLLPATASAVNEITITNAATGNAPEISATGDDTNINIDLLPKGTGKVVSKHDHEFQTTATFDTEVANGNSGASATIDWTSGNKQAITLTDNATLSFTDPAGPTNVLLRLVQDGTGSRTPSWPASVKWAGGGTAPTLTTDANAEDIVTCYYDGTNYYCTASLDFA